MADPRRFRQPPKPSAKYFPRRKRNLNPGECGDTPDCEITMVLDDGTSLYACKHRLAAISGYFHRLFTGQLEQKVVDNTVYIKDVSRNDMWFFLRCIAQKQTNDLMAIPEHCASICSLITLSVKFDSQPLKERIKRRIDTISYGQCAARTKKEMIITVDAFKRECTAILVNCVRLCSTMKYYQIASLQNKISLSTLSCIFLLRAQFYTMPPLCTVTRCKNDKGLPTVDVYQCRRLGRAGKWKHKSCEMRKRVGIAPTLIELKPFPVEMNLLMDESKWCEII